MWALLLQALLWLCLQLQLSSIGRYLRCDHRLRAAAHWGQRPGCTFAASPLAQLLPAMLLSLRVAVLRGVLLTIIRRRGSRVYGGAFGWRL